MTSLFVFPFCWHSCMLVYYDISKKLFVYLSSIYLVFRHFFWFWFVYSLFSTFIYGSHCGCNYQEISTSILLDLCQQVRHPIINSTFLCQHITHIYTVRYICSFICWYISCWALVKMYVNGWFLELKYVRYFNIGNYLAFYHQGEVQTSHENSI